MYASALAVLVAAASFLPVPAAAFAPIAVTVSERAGVSREHWPVTVSVPFARGQLQASAPVRIVADRRSGALPVQARPLVRWPDGSVRWLLLDTQVEVSANGAQRLRVEPGAPPPPAVALHVTETEETIAVDTGAIRFAVPKKRFAIIENLQPRGSAQPVSAAMSAVMVTGAQPSAALPPRRVTLVDGGPLRARVELHGTYGNDFDYIVRLEAYAGQPFVRVWHTFVDRHPTPYVSIARLGVELPLTADPPPSRYRYGIVGGRPVTTRLSGEAARLYQSDGASYAVDNQVTPGKLAGWVELSGEGAAIGLAARWFWEEFPQSLALRRDRLVYNMWAPEADPAKAGVGAAKTHEFVVWAVPPASTANTAAGMAEPLLGAIDPAWTARSRALPDAVDPQGLSAAFVRKVVDATRRYARRNATERWDDCGAVRCDKAGLERTRTGAYGMWNWGDWNFRGYQDTTKGTDSWGNLEYDTAHVLALTYAASGNADVHELMVAAARHFIDVDTIHAYPARPEWVGMNHPKNPLHFSFELGGPDLGHTWTQGALAYYYLTGDERALAAARGVADYLVARLRTVVLGNPRQWGWPQIALLAVYDATGERSYLDAARAYAQGGMRAHTPTASTHWKLGILADALAYTHAATGDAAMRAWLESYAKVVMKHKARADARAFPAVAYVAALTGDAAMRDAARARADRLDLGSWGKPYSINGRIGFRIESLLNGPPPQ